MNTGKQITTNFLVILCIQTIYTRIQCLYFTGIDSVVDIDHIRGDFIVIIMDYSFSSTTPHVSLGLYVKPTHYNREILTELSAKLINFFNTEFFNDNEMVTKWGDMFCVSIDFVLKEDKEHHVYYDATYGQNKWIEKWRETPFRYR